MLTYSLTPIGGTRGRWVKEQFQLIHEHGAMREWFMLIMTSSNGNIFRLTGHLCGEFTGRGDFPTQRPVTRSFDVFFDLRLNKRLSEQSWGWWFETLSCPLWRHRNPDRIVVWLPPVRRFHWMRQQSTCSQPLCFENKVDYWQRFHKYNGTFT